MIEVKMKAMDELETELARFQVILKRLRDVATKQEFRFPDSSAVVLQCQRATLDLGDQLKFFREHLSKKRRPRP